MNSRLTIALPIVVLGVTVFVSSAPAQMRRMGASAPAVRARISSRLGTRIGFARVHHRRFFRSSVFLPPYFYPDYDYDEYEPIATQAPPLQVIVVQPAPAPAPAARPVEPLVLENQGGQWVRISNYGQSPARAQSTQPDSAPASSLRSAPAGPREAAPPPTKLPPAVLVFRDGHKEEVKRYMIKGDVIFTGADYWSTGSWARKVPVAELDVPATLKLNEERGGKFSLPSGPNEVIIRP
ncbi:MAG: hypothetical protein WAR21_03000 [Candidatus Acidiferrales bacterium]|jgi:hypothetical protein